MTRERGVQAARFGARGRGHAWACTPRAIGAAAAVATAAALLPGAAAAASGPAPARVEILSPAEGQRTQAAGVWVRVRVSPRRGFEATVNGRDVTRRFGPARGGVRTAVLTRGRDLRVGPNRITVAAGRSATSRRIVVQRGVPRLLRVSDRLRPSGRTPVRVRIAVARGADVVAMRLNGRRVALAAPGARTQRVALGADDGLRFGRNRIVVVAHRDADGATDREVRVVRIGRATPLVGAGPARTTHPGAPVVLDGRSTKPARKGTRLLYRWHFAEKPKGSRAGIVRNTSALARLRPDVPGRYRLRLVAAPAPRGFKSSGHGPAARKPDVRRVFLRMAGQIDVRRVFAGPRDRGRSRARRSQSGLTCLTTPATPLQRAGDGPPEPLARPGQTTPATPLAAPPCVRPTGDPTPPLPLQARPLTAVDEVTVTAQPAPGPMGSPVQTIDANGDVIVGGRTYAHRAGHWAKLLVLDQGTLQTADGAWGAGDQMFTAAEAGRLVTAVDAVAKKGNGEYIVVATGMGVADPGIDVKGTSSALAKVVATLGATMPSPARQQLAMRSGRWSVLGTPGSPSRTVTNLDGLTQADPVGSGGSRPGSINGWMQVVFNSAYSYVSPEHVEIDTKAPGSSNAVSVFQIGDRTYTSSTLPSGELGLHVLVLSTDAPGAALTPLDHGTFAIDDPYDVTDQAGTKAAAAMLQRWTRSTANALIVLQTFGEDGVAPWTAPGSSPSWVNDALLHAGRNQLSQWNGQPYVSAKSAPDLAAKNDQLWNPGYPTVAGQVGDLTGQIGHDLVANFGAKNLDGAGNEQFEITRLTMVAGNQPYDPGQNFVDGYAAPKEGRLVGTLTRGPQGQLQVQAGAPNDHFGGSEMWDIAFAAPTPWPMSQTARQRAAMAYIAARLFSDPNVTDVRSQYTVDHRWSDLISRYGIGSIGYQAGLGFDEATFDALIDRLGAEMYQVDLVMGRIAAWQGILGTDQIAGQIDLNAVGTSVARQAISDSKLRDRARASLDPLEVTSEALYVAADLIGFPEATEGIAMAETIGSFASAFGFADAIFPHDEGGEGAEGPDTAEIYAAAGDLGEALLRRFQKSSYTLRHLGDIYVSDAGKLANAARLANGSWAFTPEAQDRAEQSLAVATAREIYEALLPITYQQWVIAPWQTVTNGSGPLPYGAGYECTDYRDAIDGNRRTYPFTKASPGSTALINYRGSGAPASTTPPAVPYSVGYTVRALKSKANPLVLERPDLTDTTYAITVEHSGSNPPAGLIDQLFQPVNPADLPSSPTTLGMTKTEFYAGFAGGAPSWKRMICAESN